MPRELNEVLIQDDLHLVKNPHLRHPLDKHRFLDDSQVPLIKQWFLDDSQVSIIKQWFLDAFKLT